MLITDTEYEFLQLLLKTCKATRDPRNPKSRTEMAIPAAQWEMKFKARLAEIEEREEREHRNGKVAA